MEKWNLYDRNGNLSDVVQYRGEPIPRGMYAMVGEVLVRQKDGSYLCMKRSMVKKLYPGFYEATAGGGALCGENAEECVKRELYEETGIKCDEPALVGRYVDEERGFIFFSYVCTVDIKKDSIVLQEGETEAYVWMTEPEFIEFINSDRAIDTQRDRYQEYFTSIGYMK